MVKKCTSKSKPKSKSYVKKVGVQKKKIIKKRKTDRMIQL